VPNIGSVIMVRQKKEPALRIYGVIKNQTAAIGLRIVTVIPTHRHKGFVKKRISIVSLNQVNNFDFMNNN